jgi:hypothetical protein
MMMLRMMMMTMMMMTMMMMNQHHHHHDPNVPLTHNDFLTVRPRELPAQASHHHSGAAARYS